MLELREVLALPQSTVSRHLKVLSDQGWLTSRHAGTQTFYVLAAALDPGARKLWHLTRAETEEWPVARQDAARLDGVRARRDGAQRFFAGAAGAWDELRAKVYGRAFGTEALLALLPPSWTVADLGCGTGALAAELAPRVRKVIAVDLSAAMLRAARRRHRRPPERGAARGRPRRAPGRGRPLRRGAHGAGPRLPPGAAPGAPRGGARSSAPAAGWSCSTRPATSDEALRRKMGQARPGFDPAALAALLREAGLGPRHRPIPPARAGREGTRARRLCGRAAREVEPPTKRHPRRAPKMAVTAAKKKPAVRAVPRRSRSSTA